MLPYFASFDFGIVPRFYNPCVIFLFVLHYLEHYSAEGDVPDRIKMIMATFGAFVSIGTSIRSIQREDVRAVGILLYGGKRLLVPGQPGANISLRTAQRRIVGDRSSRTNVNCFEVVAGTPHSVPRCQ
jgi:hypothetical protein